MSILIWIISGIIAGWLAGVIVKGYGFGLIGGVIGGWLAGLLGLQASSLLGQILVAALGGVVFVLIIRMIRRV